MFIFSYFRAKWQASTFIFRFVKKSASIAISILLFTQNKWKRM